MMRLVTDDYDAAPTALLHDSEASHADVESDINAWPAEVDMILSAMRAGAMGHATPTIDRRMADRAERNCRADLRLFAHSPLAVPFELFTRDVSPTTVGFITRERLPLGYTGLVRIDLGDTTVTAACNVYRCREAIGGWYEGALHFTKRQASLK